MLLRDSCVVLRELVACRSGCSWLNSSIIFFGSIAGAGKKCDVFDCCKEREGDERKKRSNEVNGGGVD